MAETVERNARASSPWSGTRYTRLVVRGLVVAGFAGVAWLLSSSVAHAADGGGNGSGARSASGAVTRLVTTLGGGPESARAHGGRVGGGSVDSGGAVLTTASDLLTRVLPATGTAVRTVHHVTEPVTGTLGRTAGTLAPRLTGSASRSAIGRHTARRVAGSRSAAARAVPLAGTGKASLAFATAANGTIATAGGGSNPASGSSIGAIRTAAARHRAGAGNRAISADSEVNLQRLHHAPLLPRPAPAPALPGTGMTGGATSMGSGSGQSGGAYAIAPTATVTGSVADRRPEPAADVLVRPLVAESPTVSPD